MLIRKIVIFIILGLFLMGIAYYFLINLSPFDQQKINELISEKNIQEGEYEELVNELQILVGEGRIIEYLNVNAVAASLIILIAIFFFFIAVHLFLDKLFFKKFFENPSLALAIRRGLLFVLGIGLIIYLRLRLFTIQELVLVPITLIFIEIGISLFINDYSKRGKKETLETTQT